MAERRLPTSAAALARVLEAKRLYDERVAMLLAHHGVAACTVVSFDTDANAIVVEVPGVAVDG